MEILLLAGTYYLAANGILWFTHFSNVVKQAESEGLVSSRNYALLMLVNIVTLNTHVSKHGPLLSLFEHYRFTNSRSSRSRAVTDVRAYRDIDDMLLRSFKSFVTSLQAVTSCCFVVFKR